MTKYAGLLLKIPCILFIIILLSACTAGCISPSSAGHQNTTVSLTPTAIAAEETGAPGNTTVTPAIPPAPAVVQAPAAIPSAARDPDLESQGSLNKIYYYTLNGNQGFIPLKVYTGVNNYITSLGPIYTGDDYKAVISNEVQAEYVAQLVGEINNSVKNPGDDARIAINLVQHIKYDANTISEIQLNTSKSGQSYIGRYPYTILFQQWGGICGEKSFLLALLLKDLGYNVALIEFDFGNSQPGHMAVGIKAPAPYAFENTGYALIESTVPTIPTFDGYYLSGMDAPISSFTPAKVIQISDGRSFDSTGTEFSDAQIEQSVYSAWGSVNDAAIQLNSSAQHLQDLENTVNSWESKAQNDYSSRNMAGYQYDVQMYNQAYSAYQNYYTTVYYPDYTAWHTLNDNFQEHYLPKETALEAKYGMNTGTNVGTAI